MDFFYHQMLAFMLMEVKIIHFSPDLVSHFATLNYEWLNTYFHVEAHDREMLDDPYTFILNPGGHILFAHYQDQIVGTVALIPEGTNTFELAKMAVDPDYRGLKVGHKLMESAIEWSREKGIEKLVLESNTKLESAIHLYKKFHFQEIPRICSPYARCNIRMELVL